MAKWMVLLSVALGTSCGGEGGGKGTGEAAPRLGIAEFGIVYDHRDVDGAELKALGSDEVWIHLDWNWVEEAEGVRSWDGLDDVVAAILAAGAEVSIRLRAGSNHWGVGFSNEEEDLPEITSNPPLDLEKYAAFVRALAERYRGQVRAYAIENEVTAGAYWKGGGANYSKYVPMLVRASREIHEADSKAVVLDFGVQSSAYGPAIARERYESGDSVAEVIDFLDRFSRQRGDSWVKGQWGGLPTDRDTLEAFLYNEEFTGKIYKPMLDNFLQQAHCDAYQLHYYEHWSVFPEVYDWIRSHQAEAGVVNPVEIWELGTAMILMQEDLNGDRIPDEFDAGEHGRNVEKLLLTVFGEGIPFAVHFPHISPALISKKGGKLEKVFGLAKLVDGQVIRRPAFDSYLRVHLVIGAGGAISGVPGLPEGTWGYEFGGTRAIWTEEGKVMYGRVP